MASPMGGANAYARVMTAFGDNVGFIAELSVCFESPEAGP